MKKIILTTIVFASWAVICSGQTKLKYYGVDDIDPDEFAYLKDSLGGNFAIVELPTDTVDWKNALAEAEKYELKIIIWPAGSGHQWTPWAWNGSSWDISDGMNVLKYAEKYTTSGGKTLLAIVMSHEPFYNNGDPFTAGEMKMLYAALKNEAPHVQLFVYMNDMAYYDKRPNTKIEDGIMDIAGTWLHCFGEAEGTCEGTLQSIDNDYALIQEKGLNMQLFFAIQTFGIEGTDYKMPSAAEMLDFGTKVLEKNKLDGVFWYPWDRVATSYTSYLSKDRYDSIGEDRWNVVRQLSQFLPATDIIQNETTIDHFSLSQNYPNPFNSVTTISFIADKSGLYTLKVFNLLGQQVDILFDQVVAAGSYQVDLNVNGLQPGMYVYTLQNNTSIKAKKMILE